MKKNFQRETTFELSLICTLLLALWAHHLQLLQPSANLTMLMIITAVGTVPVAWSALRALWNREVTMDTLSIIALIFALISSEWTSSVFICLMLSAARLLENLTAERTEHSIESLFKLRPETAKRLTGGGVEIIPIDKLAVGDTVVVDIGERVAIDGTVLSGEASVDESSLTGESLPVEKKSGSKVFSSTLISAGDLQIQVEKIGKDTTLERIIALVQSARELKPKIHTMADTFGKLYLAVIFIGSALLLFITHDKLLVLSVVLVVCADDVAVAVPLAFLAAIGTAAKRGVIIKGASHLEALGRTTTMVFDKTGTLTTGKLAVAGFEIFSPFSEKDVRYFTRIIAERSHHPVSRAVENYLKRTAENAGELVPHAENIEEVGGRGIVATFQGKVLLFGKPELLFLKGVMTPPHVLEKIKQYEDAGKSVSLLAVGDDVAGFFAVIDQVKPEAKKAIANLRKLGVKKVVMLTGDNTRVAQAVARELSLDAFHAGLLPEQKVDELKKYMTAGDEVVAMVGDGVNDAASLSLATVGIAMGAIGYDTAIESANIVLMRDDISKIPETVRLARHVRRVSLQDFGIWIVSNVIGLSLVFGGMIGPSGAAAYNFITDFFPLLNSVRVKRFTFWV